MKNHNCRRRREADSPEDFGYETDRGVLKLLSENDPAVTAKGRTKCHFPPHDFYIDPVFDFTIWRDGVLYEVGDKFTAYSCAYCTDRPYGTATGKYPDSVRGAIMDAFEMWYNGDTPAEWFQEVER